MAAPHWSVAGAGGSADATMMAVGACAPNEDARIEGLRALAAWMVVGMHYLPQALGPSVQNLLVLQTGVNLFFVLSGFVFGRYVWGAPLDLKGYALRRCMRIVPLYFVAVALYAWAAPTGEISGGLVLKHLLFLHTWENHATATALNPAFWSLPPEVEFYLFIPLIARLKGPVRVLFVMAFIGRWLIGEALPSEGVNAALRLWVHLPGIAVEFLAGAMAWQWTQTPRSGRLRWAMGLVALALWGWLAFAMGSAGGEGALHAMTWARGKTGMWAAMIYAVALAACMAGPARVNPRWRAAMLGAGSLSYGVYLLHNLWPAHVLPHFPEHTVVGLAVCVALTLLSAWVAHWGIERPARAWGRAKAQQWADRSAQGSKSRHED
ncbi:acyltransferase family protein [Inhella gelatinilytica]|uniref:Acyltransferase n=1 Tax=Inhella gelatinilytica TaxID=2795030 RepID=A0A931IV29_9BURK|nr:acyltransferase [Inhella gelatinilytica]MBH9553315.1 acyltransferase [Inhella gelatinilytica]